MVLHRPIETARLYVQVDLIASESGKLSGLTVLILKAASEEALTLRP